MLNICVSVAEHKELCTSAEVAAELMLYSK